MTSRSWVYTLNNYSDSELDEVMQIECRYHVGGIECGEQGTWHIQGYIEFKKPKRMAGMKKLIPRAHFEKRRGTRDEARAYSKKDGDYFEIGDWEAGGQGSRNDLQSVVKMIKDGTKLIDIYEQASETCARFGRFVDKYIGLREKEETRKFRDVNVEVYWGDAGTGKTRKAHEENPNIFTVNTDEPFPFEGYDGEECILIDDFCGGIKYHSLLRVLDGHQFRVNVKGGHRYAKWTKVVITSNTMPDSWYMTYGLTPALERRLNSVTEFRN